MESPLQEASGLVIGSVDYVAPDKITVVIDTHAPESIALNTGFPRPFPRVNGYLVIVVEDGVLVGQVDWITSKRSLFLGKHGVKDSGLIDLPNPTRQLRLNPLGMLKENAAGRLILQRGTPSLPPVGALVALPTDVQLRSVLEWGSRRRVRIGACPLAADADVYVDPNRLFGRHLAVLGNTGSGKSCTVAGLIRWSLEEAQRVRRSVASTNHSCSDALKDTSTVHSNARFIILDPNGEYAKAFRDEDDPVLQARVFRVGSSSTGTATLRVPLWLWNSEEWSSFSQASAKTQRPLLRRALREVKAGRTGQVDRSEYKELSMRRYLSSKLILIRNALLSEEYQFDESKFGFRLKAIADELDSRAAHSPTLKLSNIASAIRAVLEKTYNEFEKKGDIIKYYRAFTEEQILSITDALEEAVEDLGGIIYQEGPSENTPIPFDGTELADHLEILAVEENVTQYVDILVARIRMQLSDPQMGEIVNESEDLTLAQWLQCYVGGDGRSDNCISIIDLSLVPTNIVSIVVAVIARMVFEALQRYMNANNVALPTTLVMEEAHTFIRKYQRGSDTPDPTMICCQAFERIAREGRKFGLGLVLSSQRPSELSPTVLSQCNTFLLHRINNDEDQKIVLRLVPDSLKGLLRELPSLPSQMAILLGWASELPVLVKLKDLPKPHQPRSDDPEFWNVWTGVEERKVCWSRIAQDWQDWQKGTLQREDAEDPGKAQPATGDAAVG